MPYFPKLGYDLKLFVPHCFQCHVLFNQISMINIVNIFFQYSFSSLQMQYCSMQKQ